MIIFNGMKLFSGMEDFIYRQKNQIESEKVFTATVDYVLCYVMIFYG